MQKGQLVVTARISLTVRQVVARDEAEWFLVRRRDVAGQLLWDGDPEMAIVPTNLREKTIQSSSFFKVSNKRQATIFLTE